MSNLTGQTCPIASFIQKPGSGGDTPQPTVSSLINQNNSLLDARHQQAMAALEYEMELMEGANSIPHHRIRAEFGPQLKRQKTSRILRNRYLRSLVEARASEARADFLGSAMPLMGMGMGMGMGGLPDPTDLSVLRAPVPPIRAAAAAAAADLPKDLHAPTWNDMLYQLLAFRLREGHCRVPRSEPLLYQWAEQQRRVLNGLNNKAPESGICSERYHVLDSIGFCWTPETSTVVSPKPSPLVRPTNFPNLKLTLDKPETKAKPTPKKRVQKKKVDSRATAVSDDSDGVDRGSDEERDATMTDFEKRWKVRIGGDC